MAASLKRPFMPCLPAPHLIKWTTFSQPGQTMHLYPYICWLTTSTLPPSPVQDINLDPDVMLLPCQPFPQ
ncbi:uncharacterized protein ARMOST_18554 [Armillaria ostoyae]|uniref:Uncharacterized protein n=1 Tax=Armillaria ostoyae TaxID=47428 RepID=A0A284S239_ARMOS|nr:uncharacterized protein ARMOST_18554 [Armillaria ostoyae]